MSDELEQEPSEGGLEINPDTIIDALSNKKSLIASFFVLFFIQ